MTNQTLEYPPPRPVFAWIQIESFSLLPHNTCNQRYLVVDPAAAQELADELGARAWRIVETLVLASFPSSSHSGRNVFSGSIPTLLQRARGSQRHEGWGKDTMRPVIKALNEKGYFEIRRGKPLGRGKGQSETDYIVSDALFFGSRIDSTSNLTPTDTSWAEHLVDENTAPPAWKASESLASEISALPHVDGMNGSHTHGSLTDIRATVIETLRKWRWTTDIAAVIESHGIEHIAEWIIYIQSNSQIDNPGALLRSKLSSGEPAPPHNQPNQFIAVIDNTLCWTDQMSIKQKTLPTVSSLMEALEQLPPSDVLTIKDKANTAKQLNPDNPALAWREIVFEELKAAGFLS